MTGERTLLAALLESKGLHRYGAFCIAYEKAGKALDGKAGSPPSRAQFHRWLVGALRSVPYTDHTRVLEHILTGYSAVQLFAPCPGGLIPEPARAPQKAGPRPAAAPAADAAGLAGVEAVYTSRSEFIAAVQPAVLFGGARQIRAAGLSLNLICQQVAEHQLKQMIGGGTEMHCLFLDPSGTAIRAREQEEEYTPGALRNLTQLNIDTMIRLRERLPEDARARLQIAVYDETIRFNLTLVDDNTCVAQPYLPTARGVESPTLLIRQTSSGTGLYPVFEQVFEALSKRSTYL